jgi:tripartite-type tricarboxylate transporter receptor subunit TctC
MMFASPVPTLPHVKAGRLRAVAMASLKRSPAMPELPTVSESGLPGFEAATYYIVLGPANLPPAVVNRLNSEMVKASHAADVGERLAAEAATVIGGTPQQAIAYIESEITRWNKVVKAAGIKAD